MLEKIDLKYRIEQAKRLNERGDYSTFEQLVKQGKMDLKNEEILKLYIESKKRSYLKWFNTDDLKIDYDFKRRGYKSNLNYKDIQNMLDNGVTINQILDNTFFEQEIINSFIKLMQLELETKDFESIIYFIEKINIMKELIYFPKYRNMIVNAIDIQIYTELFIDENMDYYNEKNKFAFSTCLSFFKKLGYEPLKNINEMESLLDSHNRYREIKTKLFYDLGFLTVENINKLYKNHFDFVKKYTCKESWDAIKSSVDILNALPNEPNEEYYYWRELSKKFGVDAVNEFISIIKYYYFSDNDFYENQEIVKHFFEEKFENGIPKSSLFDDNFIKYFIKLILDEKIPYERYSFVSAFLVQNRNRTKSKLIGFFVLLDVLLDKLNKQNNKKSFEREILYLYFDRVFYYFEDLSKIFNEKGVTLYFCQQVSLTRTSCDAFLSFINPDWKANIESIEKKCSQIESYIVREFTINTLIMKWDEISEEEISNIIAFNLECEKKSTKVYERILVKCNKNTDLFSIFTQKNNQDRILQILEKTKKINSDIIVDTTLEYFLKNDVDINDDIIKNSITLLNNLEYSNASEMVAFKEQIYRLLCLNVDYDKEFHKIESIFLKNNLPIVGKKFKVFKILHPLYNEYNFSNNNSISPSLKNCPNNLKENMFGQDLWRDIILFSDLVRVSLGSNNRSMNQYLENLKKGNQLFLGITMNKISYNELSVEYQNILTKFVHHLSTLYNTSLYSEEEIYQVTGTTLEDIHNLFQLFSIDKIKQSNLLDRIIKMYFHFAGFNTLEEVENYQNTKIENADKRNRLFSKSDVVVEEGDFIKGIGKIDYLCDILQNGSVSKEFLGSSASEDYTPLDTDVSRILVKRNSIKEMISATPSDGYGPIYFLLKNDNRFLITREKDGIDNPPSTFDPTKIEIFKTLSDKHYGIRTGFASSEINCILMEKYDPRVGLEIVINGFYIPVADFNGKIVFTSKDYDDLRSKMQGLSYYGENNYSFSKELDLIDTEVIIRKQEEEKENLEFIKITIYKEVAKVVQKYGYVLKDCISDNLSNGTVELINTGSTVRNTYVPSKIDFDFAMRLDKSILLDDRKIKNLKDDLLKAFHQKDYHDVINGDFRLKKAYVEGISSPLKIDITFLQKKDKINYTTDLVLRDYLNSINRQDEKKYRQVIGNIVIAKKILQDASCYKSYKSDETQGGLCGVGIENWVLQNGGSFVTAAKSFLEVSEGKSWQEFAKEYYVWNFGDNLLADRRDKYPHDNYVYDNMNELGYNKMKSALQDFLKKLETNQINVNEMIDENYTMHR